MKFEQAIEHILDKEGGYVNNPKDSGGETKFGISKRSYPKLNIKDLTRQQAIEIYRRDFWQKIRADELPERIRLHVFDFAVNAGVTTAIKTLQGCIGINTDGIIGRNTILMCKDVTPWNYAVSRTMHYVNLVKKRPKDIVFLAGWLHRNLDITELSVK